MLQANARLNVAYLLREQFEQLWSYTDPEDARSFFDNWQQQLQGQDLAPYEKFALGFVEGFNNKIRVIQRRAFGLRDEEYLALKIRPLGLPEL